MYIDKIAENPKIKIALDDTDKKFISVYDIAKSPHYYNHKLLCVNCRENLEIVDGHTGFYLKHSPYGGDAHYDCSLFTGTEKHHFENKLKMDFISKQEIALNYSLVIKNDELKFYVTFPSISKHLQKMAKEIKGQICIYTKSGGCYVIEIEDLIGGDSVLELDSEPRISYLQFKTQNKRVKYHVGWYYESALFAFKLDGNDIYFKKISFEIDETKEYAFISNKSNLSLVGAKLVCLKEVIYKYKKLYVYKVKIDYKSKEVDQFLKEHDCSYSGKYKSINDRYYYILKYGNILNKKFEVIEKIIIKKPIETRNTSKSKKSKMSKRKNKNCNYELIKTIKGVDNLIIYNKKIYKKIMLKDGKLVKISDGLFEKNVSLTQREYINIEYDTEYKINVFEYDIYTIIKKLTVLSRINHIIFKKFQENDIEYDFKHDSNKLRIILNNQFSDYVYNEIKFSIKDMKIYLIFPFNFANGLDKYNKRYEEMKNDNSIKLGDLYVNYFNELINKNR